MEGNGVRDDEEEEPLTPFGHDKESPPTTQHIQSEDVTPEHMETQQVPSPPSASEEDSEFVESSLPQDSEFEAELHKLDQERKDTLSQQQDPLPPTSAAMETSPVPNIKAKRKKAKTPDAKRDSRASLISDL